jgi:DNA-binding IclR family transcriptional regulator
MRAEGEGASVSKRIIAMLRLFAEGGETLSINEISQRLELAPSSVHRLLAGLVQENIVERTAKRRYCVGREFGRIGALVARKIDVRRLARPMLQQMIAETGETALLGMMLPRSNELTIADKIDSIHALRIKVTLHARRPLMWGAQGRVVLAWLESDDVLKVIAGSARAPATDEMPPSPVALRGILADIRKAGYALTRGQVVVGAVGIAAPVFDADDRIVGELALNIPEMRFRRRDEHRLAALVVRESKKLSIALGARGGELSAAKRRYFE